jgi:hypothetical protein
MGPALPARHPWGLTDRPADVSRCRSWLRPGARAARACVLASVEGEVAARLRRDGAVADAASRAHQHALTRPHRQGVAAAIVTLE